MTYFFKPSPLTAFFFLIPHFLKLINCLYVYDQSPPVPRYTTREVGCSFVIFAITFSFGILPYFFRNYGNLLVLGVQFSGGAFFAYALHLLRESGYWNWPQFRLSLLIIGYFVTAFGDIILVRIIKKKWKKKNDHVRLERSNGNVEAGDGEVIAAAEEEEELAVAKAGTVGISVLLVLGLSIHSIYEGLEFYHSRQVENAWIHTLRICIHHIFRAIAMSFALLRMQPKRMFWTLVSCSFAFAVSTPLGMLIGNYRDVTNGIFDIVFGIISGVFLYISINHLIAKGYSNADQCSCTTPFRKFFAVILGVLLAEW